jgi:hypothetical protein
MRARFARSLCFVSDSRDKDLVVPRLPVRASIYIAPDGTVHFGALFEELVPVADALGLRSHGLPTENAREAAPTVTTLATPR